jgi:hypothetical protein
MAEFRVNLIRERVVPTPWRKALFAHLTLHVAACGLLLAWVSWQATMRIVGGRDALRKGAAVTQQFAQDQNAAGGVFDYADLQRARLALRADALDAIGDALKNRCDLARVLIGLSNHLPYGVYITDLEFDQASRKVDLQLTVSSEADMADLTISKLIEQWQGDELLGGRADKIKSVTSETADVKERKVSVWEFAITLKPEGG